MVNRQPHRGRERLASGRVAVWRSRAASQCSIASIAASALLPLAAVAQTRPNIVLFLVDDMGLMDTSLPFDTDSSGQPVRQPLNQWYHTPNMERLATTGPERQLPLQGQPPHRAERRTPPHHQLD